MDRVPWLRTSTVRRQRAPGSVMAVVVRLLVLLWVALSMLARDGLATLLVVAEAKGRHWLAGGLDSASDIAGVVCTLYGAGEIILHGWNVRGVEILAVMCATSFMGTALFTKLGQRIKAAT